MLFELFLVFITLLLLADYLFKIKRRQILKSNGFKGPSELPIVGIGHHFAKETPETVFNKFSEFIRIHGKTYASHMLHEVGIFTSDAKLVEAIMGSQQVISKSGLYNLLNDWLGTGLLLSTGRKWHSRRKIITPAFHFKILEQFVEIFDQQSSIMVNKLYDKADGKTVINMFPVVCLTALDIIAETAMGVKVHAQTNPNFSYVQSVAKVSELIAIRTMRPSQRFDLLMLLTAPVNYITIQKHIRNMHAFSDKVIAERRDNLQKSIEDGTYKTEEINDIGSKKRMAFLDVLLQATVAGNPLSNEDIREEVDTFMFEGHDTTTSGISHTLYLIARHPEVQQKLFEEIRSVIGDDKNKPVEMCDLQELKYLECVIKESLRLYPPVPIIGRYVEKDVVLNGHILPARTNITILIYHLLRDPDYFSDPNSFKPERFSAESNEKINPFAYVPFSAGPRNCIGQKFAMLEMKSTVSKVLRHFELLPLGEDVRPLMSLILRSASGTNVGLKHRVY